MSCANLLRVKRFRHLLLLVLALALPVQGVMAASRLCMPSPHAGPSAALDAAGHHATAHAVDGDYPQHPAASPHASSHAVADHRDCAVLARNGDQSDGAHDAGTSAHDASMPAGEAAPEHDHAGGTCKLCAACCLTVAVAPPLPSLALMSAGFAGYRPLVVPVPHNVADGLERPPRTI
jgi:hypothetical protein